MLSSMLQPWRPQAFVGVLYCLFLSRPVCPPNGPTKETTSLARDTKLSDRPPCERASSDGTGREDNGVRGEGEAEEEKEEGISGSKQLDHLFVVFRGVRTRAILERPTMSN